LEVGNLKGFTIAFKAIAEDIEHPSAVDRTPDRMPQVVGGVRRVRF
jgi:hypothetical protein